MTDADAPEQVAPQSEARRAVRHGLDELPAVDGRALVRSADGYPPSEITCLIGR